jgi:EAL domain-containing protein (putative c-di-GMP-specific phosphodiesterase class I)
VLAEGIETQGQWQFLAREGCDKGQGYLFAKPAPLARLPDAIRAAAQRAHKDDQETQTQTNEWMASRYA